MQGGYPQSGGQQPQQSQGFPSASPYYSTMGGGGGPPPSQGGIMPMGGGMNNNMGTGTAMGMGRGGMNTMGMNMGGGGGGMGMGMGGGMNTMGMNMGGGGGGIGMGSGSFGYNNLGSGTMMMNNMGGGGMGMGRGGGGMMYGMPQTYGGGMGMGGGGGMLQGFSYQQPTPTVTPKVGKGATGWLNYYGQPSPDEMFMLKEWYKAVDQDGSGSIDCDELRSALSAAGENFDADAVKQMVSMFDDDGNGVIDLEEFISLFRYIGAIRASFEAFDQHRKGALSCNEVAMAIARANFNLPPLTVQTLFQKFDKNKRGVLSFAQYLEMAMYLGNLRSTFERYDVYRRGAVRVDMNTFTRMLSDTYEPNL